MIDLPYDFARCQPRAAPCAAKSGCARFTSKWRPEGMQTVMDGSIGVDPSRGYCDMCIANEEEEDESSITK
jgi:hypothetical protein